MSLHHVEIKGTDDDPEIVFTCSGTRESDCHNYPACDCEVWDDEHQHPKVQHDECWMQNWFDNDATDPSTETLDLAEYTVGQSGPVTCSFEYDFVRWEFIVGGDPR